MSTSFAARLQPAEQIPTIYDIGKRCEEPGVLESTTNEARDHYVNKMQEQTGNTQQTLSNYADRLLKKLEAADPQARGDYALLKGKHEKLETKNEDRQEKYGRLKEKKTKLRIRKQAQLHKINKQLRKKDQMLKVIETLLV